MGKIKKVKAAKPSTASTPTISDENIVPQLVPISAEKKQTRPQKVIDKISFEKAPITKKTISKKEKRSKKHKTFQSKIDLIKTQETTALTRKKGSFAKKKQATKTAVIGDFKTLKDALPSLDELLKFKSANIKTGVAEYDIPKTKSQMKRENQKKKKQEMLDRMKRLTDLLKDPDYKKNARETIANHIKFSRDLADN